MIEVEFSKLVEGTGAWQLAQDIGQWLDEHMPNPPLPDPQRWTLGYSEDGRLGIRFHNDEDATHFMVAWS